jgi:hypothetical protein
MLNTAGATVTIVGNGALAVEAVVNNPTKFDLILMVRGALGQLISVL